MIGSALLLASVVGVVVRRLWRCRRDLPRVVGPGLPPVTESGRRPLGEVVVTTVVVLDDDVLVGYRRARQSGALDASTGTLVLSGLARRGAAVAALHHWRDARTALTGYLLDAGAALVDPTRGTVISTNERDGSADRP